ncbi:MAG: hypothetical protein IJ797_06765 [Selenomonadaceae bacterium]|nr:hypothetical protein [Selenomonadaceae bacterium]
MLKKLLYVFAIAAVLIINFASSVFAAESNKFDISNMIHIIVAVDEIHNDNGNVKFIDAFEKPEDIHPIIRNTVDKILNDKTKYFPLSTSIHYQREGVSGVARDMFNNQEAAYIGIKDGLSEERIGQLCDPFKNSRFEVDFVMYFHIYFSTPELSTTMPKTLNERLTTPGIFHFKVYANSPKGRKGIIYDYSNSLSMFHVMQNGLQYELKSLEHQSSKIKKCIDEAYRILF